MKPKTVAPEARTTMTVAPKARPTTTLVAAALLVLLSALAAAAQEDAAASGAEPRWSFGFDRSSHVVRQGEDRLNLYFQAEKWRFEGVLARLVPRFEESRTQTGLLFRRPFGDAELTGLVRFTDVPEGQDLVASVSYRKTRAAGGLVGGELTFASAELPADRFVFQEDEDPIAGRFYYRTEGGLEFTVFARDSATFDLGRETAELLERLPRSTIVGVETLADVDVDEERLESSFGASVGFTLGALRATVYAKSGDQVLRGLPEGEDMTGFGAHVDVEAESWTLHTEIDLRQIDSLDGVTTFDRGRLFVDFQHRAGRYEWGVGSYVQGETQSFSEIPDFYDTAGAGATFSVELQSGRRVGIWVMAEDDAPDFQKIGRLAFFRRAGEREWGVGVRRDEVGRDRFADETVGAFVFGSLSWKGLDVHGDLGVQDSDVYGKLSVVLRP